METKLKISWNRILQH
ncbi:hypothetical protein Nmel_016238 [Mimus melanotis]